MKRKPHAASRADIVFVNHSGHMTSEPYLVSNLQNDVKWLGSMHSPPLSPFSHLCDFPSPELLWQSKPSLLQPFPAEGQQVQSGFMRSLLPPRAGSVTDSCLHHGQGLWQWEKANPLHSLGHQWSHGWSGRGAVLPVSNNTLSGPLSVLAEGWSMVLRAAAASPADTLRSVCPQHGRGACSCCPPAPQRTATGWAPLVHVQHHRRLWSFWEQLKEEKNPTWENFWKRRQLQTTWYANACNFQNGSRRVCFFLLLKA